jgi:succinate-acetate transporter protein
MDNTTDSTAQTKGWANATPAGMVALAVACFCHFAMLNGCVEKSAMPLLGCWLIGGFVVQLIVALIDLKGGNDTGGNTFLFFSAFFMLAGGLETFVKHHYGVPVLLNGDIFVPSGGGVDTQIDGWAWLALSLVLLLWTPAFFKTFGLLSLIILALDVACPFIALLDLKVLPHCYAPVPAYALLTAGVLGVYYSAVLVVNKAFGKKVYPC